MSRPLLKIARQTHLYFGVFITPALLFFALTGAIQSFGLHETNRDHPDYKPAHWIAVLAQIHKKQIATVPVRKPQPAPAPASSPADPHLHRDHAAEPSQPTQPATPAALAPQPTPPAPTHNPVPLRVFFVLVCLGLFSSTATGLYMTYQYTRNHRLITLTLLAGIIIPPLLLLL